MPVTAVGPDGTLFLASRDESCVRRRLKTVVAWRLERQTSTVSRKSPSTTCTDPHCKQRTSAEHVCGKTAGIERNSLDLRLICAQVELAGVIAEGVGASEALVLVSSTRESTKA